MIDENIDNNEIVDDTENSTEEKENLEIETNEAFEPEESSEFALRMINSIKSMNSEQITHYEMVNAFTMADELRCLYLFVKSLPHSPILPMYPETPFLFFKGVALPRSFNLTEEVANDIENFMKGKNSEYFDELHLHDLNPHYLDAYESAVQMYNDMVEKARTSYLSSVKQAKSQVIEISAAIICGFIIILALVSMS
tara:strand:- start:162 stop:752 length:591 start_codon:yes stop_codon:yes gene_type:complete